MLEFEVSGQKYKAQKLNARRQFHVVRRLIPAIAGLVSVGEIMQAGKKGGEGMAALLRPFAQAVGGMSDQDSDFIIDTALSVVVREQPGGGWAPVLASGGNIMFDDIDLAAMIRIAFEVLKDNLAGFFLALSQISPGSEADQA